MSKNCSVDGCDGAVHGWCRLHWERFVRGPRRKEKRRLAVQR